MNFQQLQKSPQVLNSAEAELVTSPDRWQAHIGYHEHMSPI
jgi:hypothetical protein